MASVKDLDKQIEALVKERDEVNSKPQGSEPRSTQLTNEIGLLEDQRREAHLNEEVRDKTLEQADFYSVKTDDSDGRGKDLGRIGPKGRIAEDKASDKPAPEAPKKKKDPRGLSGDKRGI